MENADSTVYGKRSRKVFIKHCKTRTYKKSKMTDLRMFIKHKAAWKKKSEYSESNR